MDPDKNKRKGRDPFLAAAMGLGTQFVVAVVICLFGGLKIDEMLDTKPFGMFGALSLAFIYGFYEVWKLLRKIK